MAKSYSPRRGAERKMQAMRAALRNDGKPVRCYICGYQIDLDAPSTHPAALQLDHVQSVHDAPELALDGENMMPAHAFCNNSKGPQSSLGDFEKGKIKRRFQVRMLTAGLAIPGEGNVEVAPPPFNKFKLEDFN